MRSLARAGTLNTVCFHPDTLIGIREPSAPVVAPDFTTRMHVGKDGIKIAVAIQVAQGQWQRVGGLGGQS